MVDGKELNAMLPTTLAMPASVSIESSNLELKLSLLVFLPQALLLDGVFHVTAVVTASSFLMKEAKL